ncbi:MAG: Zn-ribbon domain-containing OB-fold protein [Actinomycetes bacterium]
MNAHPRPVLDADNAPFWLGCREGRLTLQRCGACGTWRFPPRPRCAACASDDVSLERASGRGEIASYTICHPPVLPAYADRVPYNVIVVRLEEGPHLVSNLLDAEPFVGMGVVVEFVDVDDELTLPQFRPA